MTCFFNFINFILCVFDFLIIKCSLSVTDSIFIPLFHISRGSISLISCLSSSMPCGHVLFYSFHWIDCKISDSRMRRKKLFKWYRMRTQFTSFHRMSLRVTVVKMIKCLYFRDLIKADEEYKLINNELEKWQIPILF